ncbi:unnamed protein product, partial [marine sediment metagenome]
EGATQVRSGQLVKLHYEGRILPTGEIFDSSYVRGEPVALRIGGEDVIEGWRRALPSLRDGEKIQLRVPARMAYGASGVEGKVPPDTDLEFDIEVVELIPVPPPRAPPPSHHPPQPLAPPISVGGHSSPRFGS